MKAEELMIGDWVIFLGKYRKVCQIGPDNQVRFYGENKVIVSADELDPIPLTTDILEKNGFANLTGHTWWYKDFHISLSDAQDLTLVCGRTIQFSFVHELQHALRLCRIEKEITI